MTAEPDQESARAAVEAGYLSLKEYLEMCKRYGWKPQHGKGAKMKVYGRKLLDQERTEIALDVDDIVLEFGNHEIVLSLYRARVDGRIEVRTNDGILVVLPRAANVIEVEARR
jgi:hypothetical protein